ncbi:MAG: amidase family protein, partial [Actinomycetota bacterium]|nr:amidase family protein [Actinomycetota bacterium]
MTATAARDGHPGPSGGPTLAGIDLEQATIPDLRRAMDDGRLTSVALTAFYLDRIRVLDPGLHSVIMTNPDAVRLAAGSDHRRAVGQARGLMDGIPVLLK